MSFPLSPSNNQTAILNGQTYIYSSSNLAWTRVMQYVTTTPNLIVSGTTISNSTTTGALTVAGGAGIGGSLYATALYDNGSRVLTVATGAASSSPPVALNDISTQFNGVTSVFTLRQDQTIINTIVDSKDLEVVINGARLTPYIKQLSYPWIVVYDSFKGFRVSGGNLIIYNAPFIGDSASLLWRNASTVVQTRKYPFSATSIALGD